MPTGAFVYKVVEGGAASQSDLQEKDIITKIDNQTIRSMEELKKMLTYYESGTTATMTVMRLENGQYVEKQVEIVLGSKPEEEPASEPETAPQTWRGFWN
jgi:serine protease Do